MCLRSDDDEKTHWNLDERCHHVVSHENAKVHSMAFVALVCIPLHPSETVSSLQLVRLQLQTVPLNCKDY